MVAVLWVFVFKTTKAPHTHTHTERHTLETRPAAPADFGRLRFFFVFVGPAPSCGTYGIFHSMICKVVETEAHALRFEKKQGPDGLDTSIEVNGEPLRRWPCYSSVELAR